MTSAPVRIVQRTAVTAQFLEEREAERRRLSMHDPDVGKERCKTPEGHDPHVWWRGPWPMRCEGAPT